MNDPTEMIKALGEETIKRAYDDVVTSPAQEAGKFLTDAVKAVRLFTAPLQLVASWQDRLERYFTRIRDGVPEERQMESPAMISGPVMDRLKYLDESNHLTELFLNLLSCSIDSERIDKAHPAFIHLIDQLSTDEAKILFELKHKDIDVVQMSELDSAQNKLVNEKLVSGGFPVEKLSSPDNFNMYYSHLQSLNLIAWVITDQVPIMENSHQIGNTLYSRITKTEFGKLFIEACVPANRFIILS